MSRKPKIAVIGGGIGGLTAAIALSRHQFEVEVYEQAPSIGEIGAGVTLSPNAIKAFAAMGLGDAIAAIGFESDYQIVRQWDSGEILSKVYRKTYRQDYGAPYFSMHRADLINVLARNVTAGAIKMSSQCTAAGTSDGQGFARFADGSEIEADLIVGADGIHSNVRRSVFGAAAPRFTGTVCWRGLIPYDRFPPELLGTDLVLYKGPRKHLIYYMVRGGELINFVAHVESDVWTGESWTQECDRSEILDTFAGWHEPLLQLIAASDQNYKWALYDRDPLKHWSAGYVTLLGDSAHAMPPFIGQGACMAVEDGYTLAAALEHSPDDVAGALKLYEGLRVPRSTSAVLQARERGEELHMTREWEVNDGEHGDKTGVNLHRFYDYDVTKVLQNADA